MKITNLEVTNNFIEVVDTTCVHIELDGCLRLIYLKDTEFKTIEELKKAIESLIFD